MAKQIEFNTERILMKSCPLRIAGACLLLLATILASGCGRMLPGRIYAVPEGRTINFEIETSYGHGELRGHDPVAGESFAGEYSAFYKGAESVHGNIGSTDVNIIKPPVGANAYGILVGDMGTTIRLYFEIKPGIRPSGFGKGTDQSGVNYEAYF